MLVEAAPRALSRHVITRGPHKPKLLSDLSGITGGRSTRRRGWGERIHNPERRRRWRFDRQRHGSVRQLLAGQPGTTTGPGAGGAALNSGGTGQPGSATPSTSPTSLAAGGAGGDTTFAGSSPFSTPGGGGGGYYAGGGSDGPGGVSTGGGGGSAFISPTATNVTAGAGNTGAGQVTLRFAQLATTTTLTAGANATSTIDTTLTVTVAPSAGSTAPVSFCDGSTLLGNAALANGTASLPVRFAAGSHTLTAAFPGDGVLAASTSAPVTITVRAPAAPAAATAAELAATGTDAAPALTLGGLLLAFGGALIVFGRRRYPVRRTRN